MATVAASGRHCGDGKVCRFLCQLLRERRFRIGCLAFVTDDDLYLLSVLVPLQSGVGSVSELQAQRVLAWFKFERDLCLALAVVEMLLVGGDDLSGRDEVGIDEMWKCPAPSLSRRRARPRDRWPPSLPRKVTQRMRCRRVVQSQPTGIRSTTTVMVSRYCRPPSGVGSVSELQAQGVLAWLKFERDLCLALAVVEMLLVGGDDLSGRDEVGIDEDMEVSGSFVQGLDHELRHHYLKWRRDGGAVGGLFEANRRGYGAGFDDDGDGVAVLAALQCGVGSVSELQAQRVLAWFKFERDLCLALAVVEMLLVGGDDVRRYRRDMEVSGAFTHETGGRHHGKL